MPLLGGHAQERLNHCLHVHHNECIRVQPCLSALAHTSGLLHFLRRSPHCHFFWWWYLKLAMGLLPPVGVARIVTYHPTFIVAFRLPASSPEGRIFCTCDIPPTTYIIWRYYKYQPRQRQLRTSTAWQTQNIDPTTRKPGNSKSMRPGSSIRVFTYRVGVDEIDYLIFSDSIVLRGTIVNRTCGTHTNNFFY